MSQGAIAKEGYPSGAGAAAEHLQGRLLSLDVFRGITIAGMILVNNPGTWSAVYGPLRHAEWHGWTPTDLIFPFFLFIVGAAIALAFARRIESGSTKADLYQKIARRSLIIFALGLLMNGFPFFDLSKIRIPGVLQRIAVCYLLASLIFLWTSWRGQVIAAALLLVGYWALMMHVPVPGIGAGNLSKQWNLAAYIDRALLAGHLYTPDYDPEGILSTIPAIATTLFGALAGQWLQSDRAPRRKAAGLFVAGIAGLISGWIWNAWFPINKPLWTSSYVLFTAGAALLLLGLCYWVIDIKGYKAWSKPFVIFGVNALAVFVLSSLVAKIMVILEVTRADGSRTTLKAFIYDHLFARWASPANASLAFAICYVLFWLGVMAIFYRRRIIIKV